MAAGHPLTDEDRWPWLDTIAAWIDERVAAGEPAVVTCSALKKIYRDKLRRQGVVFVYMPVSYTHLEYIVCQVCRQHAALVSNRCQGIGPALCELLDQP